MAEEEVIEEEKEEVAEEAGEPSEVEVLATKLGWNPNHEGGDREFVSAEDFILRSKEIQNTMSKQMKSLKRETAELKQGIGQVKQHNETVYKVQVKALKSRIKELETMRKEAVEDNDSVAVANIDSQIQEINDIPETLPANQSVEPSKEFIEWVDKNDWYNENPEMKAYADALGEKPEMRVLPLKKLFEVVTKEVKKMFPENFDDPKPAKPKVAAVEGAGNGKVSKPKSKSKFTYNDLSDEQKEICKFNVKHKLMTQEEYISQLEEIAKSRGLA